VKTTPVGVTGVRRDGFGFPLYLPNKSFNFLKICFFVFHIVMYPPYFLLNNKPFPHKSPLKFTQICGRSLFFGVSEDTGVSGEGRPPFSP
jgi:hypothetical protein